MLCVLQFPPNVIELLDQLLVLLVLFYSQFIKSGLLLDFEVIPFYIEFSPNEAQMFFNLVGPDILECPLFLDLQCLNGCLLYTSPSPRDS